MHGWGGVGGLSMAFYGRGFYESLEMEINVPRKRNHFTVYTKQFFLRLWSAAQMIEMLNNSARSFKSSPVLIISHANCEKVVKHKNTTHTLLYLGTLATLRFFAARGITQR